MKDWVQFVWRSRQWFDIGTFFLFNFSNVILDCTVNKTTAIALSKAVWIIDRGRTSIPSVTDLLNAVNADPRIAIYPLDKTVEEESINLPAIAEMHDRLIVATAIAFKTLKLYMRSSI